MRRRSAAAAAIAVILTVLLSGCEIRTVLDDAAYTAEFEDITFEEREERGPSGNETAAEGETDPAAPEKAEDPVSLILADGTIEIDGTTLPLQGLTLDDILNAGWTLTSYSERGGNGDIYRPIPKGDGQTAFFRKDAWVDSKAYYDAQLTCYFYNGSEEEKPARDCPIIMFSVDNGHDDPKEGERIRFSVPAGVTQDSTRAQIEEAFGRIPSYDDYSFITYRNQAYQSVEMYFRDDGTIRSLKIWWD